KTYGAGVEPNQGWLIPPPGWQHLPGIPLPLGGGEGARRAGEGVVHGPNACEKRKGAFHEPTPHPFPLPIRWGEGGRRSGEGWFMVPMRAQKRMEALHEPSRRECLEWETD